MTTINNQRNLEEELADLIRMHGTDNESGGFRMHLQFKLIVKGEDIAEEYSDLSGDETYPCCVDYIAVDSDSITPWFHMYTAYASYFPLSSNDKYSIGCLGEETIRKIYDSIVSKHGNSTKNSKRLKELNRAKWMKIASKHDNTILRGSIKDTDPKTGRDIEGVSKKGMSFSHAVDCTYCCFDATSYSQLIKGLTLDDIENRILSSIGKTEAFFIKIKYPDKKALDDSSYLACQREERWVRWTKISKLIIDKINSLITEDEFKLLMDKSPEEVLLKGRLIDDKIPPLPDNSIIEDTIKKEYKRPSSWLHPDWNTEKSRKDKDFKQKEESFKKTYLDRMTKLKTPRYEIILSDDNKAYIEIQFEAFMHKLFNSNGNSNSHGFECIIPTYGTKIYDHLDEKEHYMFDIFHYLKHETNDHDNERAFFRLKKEDTEVIVKFWSCEERIDKRDLFKNEKEDFYLNELKKMYDTTLSLKRDTIVSENTGNSCLLPFYKFNVWFGREYGIPKEFSNIYPIYEKKFLSNEESVLVNALETFDFQKWNQIYRVDSNKNENIWWDLVKELPIRRLCKLREYAGPNYIYSESIPNIRSWYISNIDKMKNQIFKKRFKDIFTELFIDKVMKYLPTTKNNIEDLYFHVIDEKKPTEKDILSINLKYAMNLLIQLEKDGKL